MNKSQSLGEKGEARAARWLQKNKGFKILERNWRSGSFSELDIIAIDPSTRPQTLVAVEVKTRVSLKFGHGITAITPRKLRALKRSLAYFVKTHPRLPKKLRIDAVDVLYQDGKEVVKYYRSIL